MSYLESIKKYARIENPLARNLLAEFYGTALLRFIGTGVLAQFVLGRGMVNTPVQVSIGWGFAVGLGVYVGWKTSGGHVNPAVTTALFIHGKISFSHGLLYIVAQILGSFFGSGIMHFVYLEAINNFDGGVRTLTGPNATASIFATFPQPYLSNSAAFVDQVAGTALVAIFVVFCCEPKNEFPVYLQPALFGLVAVAIQMCLSMNLGGPVNPASDFGSRLQAALTGYGFQMFTFHNYFFLAPFLGPFVGAAVGAYSYIFFIGIHIPDSECPKVIDTKENGKITE